MQLWEHYTTLYSSLSPKTEATVSLPELSGIVSCTERNVKLLLRGMREQGWIEWTPGRGRGRRSELRLLADPDKLLAEQAAARLQAGQWSSLPSLLQQAQGHTRLLRLVEESLLVQRHSAGTEDILRFPSYRMIGGLDPAFVTRRTELHMVRQLFDTLVRYCPDTRDFVPQLAHHWEQEGLRWTFHLQKRVRFHNGAVMTSRDAAATLLRLREEGPYAGLFRCIDRVTNEGDYTLTLQLHEPVPWLLSLLASAAGSIVPAVRPQEFAAKPIGTGPFRLASRDERLLALEANPDYFLRPALLDRVEMWCFPELYEMRKLAWQEPVREMNFHHFHYGERKGQPWQEVEQTDRGCKYFVSNPRKRGPLQKASRRRQLALLLQEEDIADEAGGNRGPRAHRLLLEREDDPTSEVPGLAETDPREPFTLNLAIYPGGGHEADAAWLQDRLQARGVTLLIRIIPFEAITADETLIWADLLLMELPVDDDAEWTLLALLLSPAGLLARVLPDSLRADLSRLLEPLHRGSTRERRFSTLMAAEELLLQTHILLPWYRWRQSASFPPELQCVTISSFGWVNYRHLWFRSAEYGGLTIS